MKVWLVLGCLVMMASGVAMAGKDKAPAEKAPAAKAGAPGKRSTPDDKTGGAALQAEQPLPDTEGAAEDPLAGLAHIVGPKLVGLGHQAQIDLPAGMNLFEQAAAQDLMRKFGNNPDRVIAAIVPPAGTGDWLVVISASDVGYVSDSDANELDAAEMLEQFKRSTLEQNKKRVTQGIPELLIDGWTERPHYEQATHHLVWGLDGHDTNSKFVNFFTRFLGRNGYLSVNLIDGPTTIEASKGQALSVLNALHFTPGARYEDHEGGDKDSGLGLKALVLGGAGVVIAKKTGILVAILLALKKLFIVVIAAIGGFFRWLFGRKKPEPDGNVASSEAPLPPPSDPDLPPAG
jgi:uncharacterized membrane-anchored protein